MRKKVTVDGCTACAHVVHATNEIVTIYPITPSSPIAEICDAKWRHGAGEYLGLRTCGKPDAVRGRRRRCSTRVAHRGRPYHDHLRLPGSFASHTEHVQDRGGTDPDGLSHDGPVARRPGPLHLRRPFRRHGGPVDRFRYALFEERPGGHGLRPYCPRR